MHLAAVVAHDDGDAQLAGAIEQPARRERWQAVSEVAQPAAVDLNADGACRLHVARAVEPELPNDDFGLAVAQDVEGPVGVAQHMRAAADAAVHRQAVAVDQLQHLAAVAADAVQPAHGRRAEHQPVVADPADARDVDVGKTRDALGVARLSEVGHRQGICLGLAAAKQQHRHVAARRRQHRLRQIGEAEEGLNRRQCRFVGCHSAAEHQRRSRGCECAMEVRRDPHTGASGSSRNWRWNHPTSYQTPNLRPARGNTPTGSKPALRCSATLGSFGSVMPAKAMQ